VKGGDGIRVRSDTVVRRVQRGLRDGAIVLLHDAAEYDDRDPASIEALPRILERIGELGLETVSVERFVPVATERPTHP
jgi:peptidoglycan/xylan/chitin deacetylase (PgdA/CDA1 family)